MSHHSDIAEKPRRSDPSVQQDGQPSPCQRRGACLTGKGREGGRRLRRTEFHLFYGATHVLPPLCATSKIEATIGTALYLGKKNFAIL
jgi:hypothetical protein